MSAGEITGPLPPLLDAHVGSSASAVSAHRLKAVRFQKSLGQEVSPQRHSRKRQERTRMPIFATPDFGGCCRNTTCVRRRSDRSHFGLRRHLLGSMQNPTCFCQEEDKGRVPGSRERVASCIVLGWTFDYRPLDMWHFSAWQFTQQPDQERHVQGGSGGDPWQPA